MYKTIIRLLIVAAATYYVPTLRLPNETVLLIVVGSAVGFLLLDNIMDDTLEGIDPDSPESYTPAPVTPAPDSPAPDSPAPVTPAPDSPAPVTPAPDSPAPVTPAPVTPEPGLDTTVWYGAKDVTIDTFSSAQLGAFPGISSSVSISAPVLVSYKQPDKKYQFKFEKNDDGDSTYYIKIREKGTEIDDEYLGKNKYLPMLGVAINTMVTKIAFKVTKKQEIKNAYEITDTNGIPVITASSRQDGVYILDIKNRTPDSADFFELIHPSPTATTPTTTTPTTTTPTTTTPTPTTPTPTTPEPVKEWYEKPINIIFIICFIAIMMVLIFA
jgi:hypothetical protein